MKTYSEQLVGLWERVQNGPMATSWSADRNCFVVEYDPVLSMRKRFDYVDAFLLVKIEFRDRGLFACLIAGDVLDIPTVFGFDQFATFVLLADMFSSYEQHS